VIVAIDGPAAAGKGTLGRRLAGKLGFAFLDTGLLYRAVGARLLAEGHDPADPAPAARMAAALRPGDLERPDLRTEAVSEAASVCSAIPGVRAALLSWQRDFANHPPGGAPGAVLDGRDIGSVVCPGAQAKLFVTASLEVRAERRHKELLARGVPAIYARVLQDLTERDRRDSERGIAPLRAGEAFVLDTTSLDAEAALQAALEFVRSRLAARRA
jgi:CMP/dCMP kinase